MPRQSRGRAAPARSAPSRPVAAPQRSNATPPGPPARSATTAAHPPAVAGQKAAGVPAQQNGSSPGLFGQMASTAAGVAVGSSIGHAIGGLFGGGSSNAPVAETPQNSIAAQGNETAYENNSWGARSCEVDAKQFTKCLDENGGNMQICGWYLEQLKACQQTASQY